MKKIINICFLLFTCAVLLGKATVYAKNFDPTSNYGICFKENLGQVSDQYYKPRTDVLFSGTDGRMNFHLKKGGISYQLYHTEKKEINLARLKNSHLKELPVASPVSIYRVDISWLNANPNSNIEKGEALPDYESYYMEVCPNGVTNVKSYKELVYKNLYSGINIHYYSKEGGLKYDYLVAPHADYKQIQLEINGAEKISVNGKGELVIKTPFGNLIEQSPLVIQNGKQLPAKWIVTNNVVSFEIKNANHNFPLVIDPFVRVWGTYYGGLTYEEQGHCNTDPLGNVYLTGWTDSNIGTVIATVGSHQTTFAGNFDNFLVKFNSNGVRLWGTYYGGVDYEWDCYTAFDASGNVYLASGSGPLSSGVIATTGSHQPFFGGGAFDAFLVKFNSNGVRLWATYYGGSDKENGFSCCTDLSGNVYLAGWTETNTSTLIATPGSYQATSGGLDDAFLVKFNSNGVRQWGTYYGGPGGEDGRSVRTDLIGNIYLCGNTAGSTVNIASVGAHQTVFGGYNDSFLAKFDAAGVRIWATYYGGSGNDRPTNCSTDSVGNIYLSGSTTSTASISTSGSHQSIYGGGSTEGDGFLVKFNSDGIRKWGTYYGGLGDDDCYGLSINNDGKIFIAGMSTSSLSTEIASSGSYQSLYGGNGDVYLAKFDSLGTREWGTYYGGLSSDFGGSCAVDVYGSVYFSGYTDDATGTIIATPGSHQPVFGGLIDAFLIKFNECTISNGPGCVGIEELEQGNVNVNIYPNPNNGNFIIEAELEMTLFVVNELGQKIQELNLSASNNYKTQGSNLNAGVYFITSSKNRINKKIVVLK